MDKDVLLFFFQTVNQPNSEEPLFFVFQTMVQWWFKNIVVPVITLVLTIFFKATSKPAVTLERNDGFVCFDLCASAIFVFVIGMIDLANQLVNSPTSKITELLKTQQIDTSKISELQALLQAQNQIIVTKFGLSSLVLLIMIILTVVISVITRCFGWDSSGKAKWGWGIVIPNILGLALLIVAAIWIKP